MAKEKLSMIQSDCVIVTIFMPPAMNASLWSLDIPNTETQNSNEKKKIKNICIGLYFRVSALFYGSIIIKFAFTL